MKKIWSYISFFLLGIIGGMVIMFEVAKKSISNTTIKGRIKQKKNFDSDIDMNNNISTKAPNSENRRNGKKLSRKQRKIKRMLTKTQKS